MSYTYKVWMFHEPALLVCHWQWPNFIFLLATSLHVSRQSHWFAWFCRMPLVIYLDILSYLTNILGDPVGGHGRAACLYGIQTECTFLCDEGCVLIPLSFILADPLFCMLVTELKVTNACRGSKTLARARLKFVNLMYHLCTASTIGPVVASKLQKSPVREHAVVRYPLVVTPAPNWSNLIHSWCFGPRIFGRLSKRYCVWMLH